MSIKKKNLAVFVSGSGTNFDAVQKSILENKIKGKINILISSSDRAGALEKAVGYGIDTCVMQQNDYDDDSFAEAMLEKLKQYNTNFIILAGYLKKIPKKLIHKFQNRIINIHPALLPKFGGTGMYGIHVHEAVLQAKENISGPTVHFVDDKYDHGLIIMQYRVPVKQEDSPSDLQKRVLEQEHKILPRVVQLLCDDKIRIKNNKIVLED